MGDQFGVVNERTTAHLAVMDDVNSSPLSSTTDNSDEVNTSTAKVYFGPILSPEKKLAPLLSPHISRALNLNGTGPFLQRRPPRLSYMPHDEMHVSPTKAGDIQNCGLREELLSDGGESESEEKESWRKDGLPPFLNGDGE